MRAPTGPHHHKRVPRPSRRVTVAHAHTGDTAYLYVVVNGRTLVGSLQLPVVDLAHATGLTLSGIEDREALSGPRAEAVQRYVAEHFSIRINRADAEISFREAQVRVLSSGSYLYMDYVVPGLELQRPALVEVTYDALIDSMPHRQALVIGLVSYGWRGLYRHAESQVVFDEHQRSCVIEVPEPTALENLAASSRQSARIVRGKARAVLRRSSRSAGKA